MPLVGKGNNALFGITINTDNNYFPIECIYEFLIIKNIPVLILLIC